jgi:hypothetical protein
MTVFYLILGILVVVGLFSCLGYFIPLRPRESGFEYVYVNEEGTVSELDDEDLKTEFSPDDGARPYIKGRYNQRTPDNKIAGFILRNRVPKRIDIMPYKNPNEERIIAWIYLAVSMASQTEPADFKGISMIADGINHAAPAHKELQTSISWLISKGLINKVGKKYTLTEKGKEDYANAQVETNALLNAWDNLEKIIKAMPNKTYTQCPSGHCA